MGALPENMSSYNVQYTPVVDNYIENEYYHYLKEMVLGSCVTKWFISFEFDL